MILDGATFFLREKLGALGPRKNITRGQELRPTLAPSPKTKATLWRSLGGRRGFAMGVLFVYNICEVGRKLRPR